uniref:Uncharacterized protein n=1 Tax=Candidatus Methanogaster sp. ANME-2c ERB4 TaxID=2759911 RepID=A0A7G9Y2E5_9EURY|nr:hypothetical protein EHLBLFLE_00001 [Methanosarcinales archaeon ANME-2c ERB4]QNO42402.1 hypothetical protein LFOPHFOE_00042 [Methanosarcinales archaeon ANME-2c ERB4]
MKRYLTPKEFYKFAAVTTFIAMGVVGIIIFYPAAELPAYAALMSLVLGAMWGVVIGWMTSVGEQDRESNKIDILKLLIFATLSAPPYLGIVYLVTKFNETYDVIPLAGSGALAVGGVYLFIWYVKHGWNS